MRDGGRRARVRAGGPAARSAHVGAQGHRAAADGRRPQRGPRRHRHRRRRPRGGGAGVLRAQGPRGRAQGLHPRQGRGPHAARSSSARSSKGLYYEDQPLGPPSRCSSRRARRPRPVRAVADRAPRLDRRRSACRSAATSARCRRRSRRTRRRSSSATGCAARPTTTAGPARSTSCRSSSVCPTRRCASSATT